jgi:DNA polymerase IIIc chi subunit
MDLKSCPTIKYYIFNEEKFVGQVGSLLAKILQQDLYSVACCVHDIDYWDKSLWTNPKDSFLPHFTMNQMANIQKSLISTNSILIDDMPLDIIKWTSFMDSTSRNFAIQVLVNKNDLITYCANTHVLEKYMIVVAAIESQEHMIDHLIESGYNGEKQKYL